ncbi:MAG TPA: hypothetical protein VNF47_16635 [Streptosporangiaceae bacterium]|nr:hypothetical protein [Streptosporangiaceae bacterium]
MSEATAFAGDAHLAGAACPSHHADDIGARFAVPSSLRELISFARLSRRGSA